MRMTRSRRRWGSGRRRAASTALLFKRLATLRTDAKLFRGVGTLRWRGPTAAFAAWTERAKAPRLLERAQAAATLQLPAKQ